MESSLRRAILEARQTEFASDDAHAAVAIVLWGPELELLVIRRADRPEDPWSGHMALPGGRREAFDADLAATALRETEEEVGIQLSEGELWGSLEPLQARGSLERTRMWVTPFVFRLGGERPKVRPDSSEVAEVLWIPLSTLLARETQTMRMLERPQGTLRFPAWQVGSQMIWGLTHSILSQLLKHALLDTSDYLK